MGWDVGRIWEVSKVVIYFAYVFQISLNTDAAIRGCMHIQCVAVKSRWQKHM